LITQSIETDLGLTWHALLRYDLIAGSCSTVVTGADLNRAYGSRCWINGLVGIDCRAERVYCVVGSEQVVSGGTSARYELCAVSLTDGELEAITDLYDGFL
jgi:hypothetical protein